MYTSHSCGLVQTPSLARSLVPIAVAGNGRKLTPVFGIPSLITTTKIGARVINDTPTHGASVWSYSDCLKTRG